MKQCKNCLVEKPLVEFYKHPDMKDGRVNRCKPCKLVERNQRYSPQDRWAQHIRDKYGLSTDQYAAMLDEQDGVCAICAQPETAMNSHGTRVMPLAIDHDHETGKLRGLLCRSCNQTLGRHNDDAAWFTSAAEYLTTHVGFK